MCDLFCKIVRHAPQNRAFSKQKSDLKFYDESLFMSKKFACTAMVNSDFIGSLLVVRLYVKAGMKSS